MQPVFPNIFYFKMNRKKLVQLDMFSFWCLSNYNIKSFVKANNWIFNLILFFKVYLIKNLLSFLNGYEVVLIEIYQSFDVFVLVAQCSKTSTYWAQRNKFGLFEWAMTRTIIAGVKLSRKELFGFRLILRGIFLEKRNDWLIMQWGINCLQAHWKILIVWWSFFCNYIYWRFSLLSERVNDWGKVLDLYIIIEILKWWDWWKTLLHIFIYLLKRGNGGSELVKFVSKQYFYSSSQSYYYSYHWFR